MIKLTSYFYNNILPKYPSLIDLIDTIEKDVNQHGIDQLKEVFSKYNSTFGQHSVEELGCIAELGMYIQYRIYKFEEELKSIPQEERLDKDDE